VTASIERIDFHGPVFTGDVVSFLTCTESTGTSSVRVRVRVDADHHDAKASTTVTEARLTMVSIDAQGRPIPFTTPPTVESRGPRRLES
jgi:acyl-CoA thioesterase YciA